MSNLDVEGYTNNTGFPLTYNDQLNYNTWLANQAHTHGLSVALKNDLGQIHDLLPYFDWVLDEQCFQYTECGKLLPFIQANKAVMKVEYKLAPSQFCPKANTLNFNSMKKQKSALLLARSHRSAYVVNTGRFKSREPGPVILSEAKNPSSHPAQILRFTQNDRAV